MKRAVIHEDLDSLVRVVDLYEAGGRHEIDTGTRFWCERVAILCCRYLCRDLLVDFLRIKCKRQDQLPKHNLLALEQATQGTLVPPTDIWYAEAVIQYLLRLLVFLVFAGKEQRDRLVIDRRYVADRNGITEKLIKELYRLGWRKRCQPVIDLFKVYVKNDWRQKIEQRYQ